MRRLTGASFGAWIPCKARAGAVVICAAFLLVLVPASQAAAQRSYAGSFGPDGTKATNFIAPGPIAVDQKTHDIYVADVGAGKLYKFNKHHEPAEFSALGASAINGLSFAGFVYDQVGVDSTTHNIYIASLATNEVEAFKANGEPAEFSALSGSSKIGGFGELCGVAVARNGDIYAGDFNGLSVFEGDGAPLASGGPFGYCNLAVDSNRVVDANQEFGEIHWFSPTPFFGSPEGTADPNPARTVAVDPSDNNIYVDEAAPVQRIARYEGEGGAEMEELGAEGSGEGELHGSTGLAVDSGRGEVYASDTEGSGRVAVFAPPPPSPPVAITGATSSGANFSLTTLEGEVNPEGFEVDDCHFEYGTTTEYGTNTPCVPSGGELGEGTMGELVSAETEPLEPNTEYHYRLVASNPGGPGKGLDRTFITGPSPPDACENKERRAEQGIATLLLPKCMAVELVSPSQKGGGSAEAPIAISANGERVNFFSVAALDGTPGPVNPGGDAYVATREKEKSGWTTASTSPPVEIIRGWAGGATALSFTPDFSRWFQLGGTQTQYQLGIGQAFEGGLGGFFSPLSPPLTPLVNGEKNDVQEARFQGASADHSHLYFIPGPFESPPTAYLPGDPEPSGAAADHNTYVAQVDSGGQPSLELLARDRSGNVWGGSCGTRLGGIRESTVEPTGNRGQGAISVDGSRAYFSTRPGQPQTGVCSTANKLRILERLESKQGPWIGELFSSECNRTTPAPACSTVDGNDYYQGASTDGTEVYFTTNRQLANSDEDSTNDECSNISGEEGCDLYLFDSTLPPGHRIIQVSAGKDIIGKHEEGKKAEVYNGVAAISGDGSHVYYVAGGVLSGENAEHQSPTPGQPNLYVWDRATEATAFIGTLNAGDGNAGEGALWGSANGILPVPELGEDAEGNQVGGNGHILPFLSKAELTLDDTDGSRLDVFSYDADTETLVRISKAAAGGSDDGSFDAEGGRNLATLGTDFAEEGREVDEEGDAVVFKTAEGLIPGDVNGAVDYYLWRDGHLYRLPGAVDKSQKGVTLSRDGLNVAFLTATPLLPQDGDSSPDVYVARAEGGFPTPPVLPVCVPGENCQHPPPPSPAAPNAASESATGTNVSASRCRRGFIRRHGRCVKQKHTRRHKKHGRKAHSTRHANTDRRAGK